MFYTGAPQNNNRTPIEKCKIEEALELMKHNGILPENTICHAPYLINLGNIVKPNIFDFSLDILINEIERCFSFGCKILVLHPGSSLGEDRIRCLDKIIYGLNKAFEKTSNKNVVIAVETMSGKGNELGVNFDEIGYIVKNIEDKSRIGVCLDTCHIHDAGYDLDDFDTVLESFNKKVGLEYLKVIHLNDSKNPRSSHKDRHENLGFGYIGFERLMKVVYHPLLENIPKILESPYIKDKAPYREEIKMIKSRIFDKNCFDNI
jgi:deoxyribonuclease-4